MPAVSPWIPRNYNNFQLRPSLHPPTEPGRLSHAMNCCLLTSSSSKAGSVFAISSRVRHAAVSCLPACLHAFLWMQPKQVIEDDEWWQFLVAESILPASETASVCWAIYTPRVDSLRKINIYRVGFSKALHNSRYGYEGVEFCLPKFMKG